MTDQSPNDQFHASAFMQGHNAEYLEQLYAQYASDPNAVDAAWQDFFPSLATLNGREGRGRWPLLGARRLAALSNDDLTAALDWSMAAQPETKAAGDKIKAKAPPKALKSATSDQTRGTRFSIRALMIIRAYRIRGHLAADLDPLGMREASNPELDPKSYGFTDADMDRPIFIDNVLGSANRHHAPDRRHRETHLLRHIRAAIHAYFRPRRSGWLKERIEGYGKEIQFPRGPQGDPQQDG